MAYTLQAIVAKKGTLVNKPVEGMYLVSLKQDYEMLPFTDTFIEKHQIPFLPLTDEGAEILPENITKLCSVLSTEKQLAYVEAEFFGGDGIQASAVFKNGKLEVAPIVDESAINQALKLLGVAKNAHFDEFEAIGLNQHRDTNKWIR